jgi:hypothetical protein
MIIQFFKLLTITITHTYYSENCRDFAFIIPADTAQLLRDGKLLAKVVDGRLIILFEADEEGVSLVPIAGKTLRIGLALRNPYFSNFSDLGPDSGALTLLYLNSDTSAALNTEKTILVGNVLSHLLADKARPVLVSLKDSNGLSVRTETITATDSRTSVSYDLTAQQAGSYLISELYPGSSATSTIYHDAELLQHRPFGVIEIKIDNSFYTTTPKPLDPELEIAFEASKDTLKYYVVAKNNTNALFFDKLTIVDVGYNEENRPEVLFDRVSGTALGDDDIPAALLGEIPENILLFKSRDKVSRQETARKKIQLTKNGDVLIRHLPQLAADKVNGDIIIQISK